MLSLRLDLLSVTESWLTSNDYHSRPHGFTWRLRCLSLAKIHSHRRWTCCYRTQRASCFAKWRLYFFFVRTFWFNYHLWQQGFSPSESTSTSTVQEKWLYSRKVFLRILCVIRRVDCYILSIPSLWWFQLSRRCRLKCKHQTILWPFFSADMSSSMRAHRDHTLELFTEMWKSRLCCEIRPNIGGGCIGAFWSWVSCGIVGLRHSIWFGCRYNCTFIPMETVAPLLTCHKLWTNTTKHSVTASDLFHQWLMRYRDCPCPPRLTKRMLYIEWERMVHSLAITHKEIRYATRVYPVLQPFFNRRLELSVEQDCLLWGPRVIKPTRFWKSCTQVTHALYGRRKGVLFTYGGRTLIRKLNKLCEAAAAVNKLENHL